MKSLKSRVWSGEEKRPFIQKSWPLSVKLLLRKGWSSDAQERPDFTQIYDILKKECVRVRNGNDEGLEHYRRRSTFVFRGNKNTGPSKRFLGKNLFSSRELKAIEEVG